MATWAWHGSLWQVDEVGVEIEVGVEVKGVQQHPMLGTVEGWQAVLMALNTACWQSAPAALVVSLCALSWRECFHAHSNFTLVLTAVCRSTRQVMVLDELFAYAWQSGCGCE